MEYLLNIILAVATIILAWATVKLARHTKALSDLTNALVAIEEHRDNREKHEKHIQQLQKALLTAERVQAIYRDEFTSHLHTPGRFPEESVRAIEELQSFSQHIEDPDTRASLNALCSIFDHKRREKQAYNPGHDNVNKHLDTIQKRIQWSVDKWRLTISGGA